jgi:hypothetical protein
VTPWSANWTAEQTLFLPGIGTWTLTCARYWTLDGVGYRTGPRGAYVCPKCLKIWAVRKWTQDSAPGVFPAFCENCPTGGTSPEIEVPGSLFPPFYLDPPLLEVLPLPLLEREVRLTMKRLEML